MKEGLVLKSTGSHYTILTDDNKIVSAKIRGRLRIKGIRTTNPVSVGDKVILEDAQGELVICDIKARKNYIIRKSTNLSKEAHIIAANIDQALLIVTLSKPSTPIVFIDRFLASAEAYNIPTIIVFNKIDVYSEEEKALLENLKKVYSKIGYKIIETAATENIGINEVKNILQGKISVFSGISGVGKSTIANLVEPGLNIKTSSISKTLKTGKHTTTFAEMHHLKIGGFLIDTPGLRSFGTVDMKKEEIYHYFPEFFNMAKDCKFNNCIHINEPGCAVIQAIEDNKIAKTRYVSYLSMIEEDSEEKYR